MQGNTSDFMDHLTLFRRQGQAANCVSLFQQYSLCLAHVRNDESPHVYWRSDESLQHTGNTIIEDSLLKYCICVVKSCVPENEKLMWVVIDNNCRKNLVSSDDSLFNSGS